MSQPVVFAGWLSFRSLPPKHAIVAFVVTEDIFELRYEIMVFEGEVGLHSMRCLLY